jgi:hypothetical protein
MKSLFTSILLTLSATTFAQIPSYVPSNGLVGWWPFNGNANDESGNGNNGTVNGATLTTDRFGVAAEAFYFSSQNCETFIDAQINTASINGALSIAFWSLRSGSGCISPRIMKFDNNDGPGTLVFQWPNNISPSVGYVSSTGVSGFYSYQNISDSVWSHIVLTIDGSMGKLYQDGEFLLNFTCSGDITLGGHANFGRMTNPLYDAMNGKIDDIGVWSIALTACEIKDLYNSQLGSQNTYSSQSQTAIDSYTWPVNGQTYTQSGVYVDTLVNATGCDSIVTLNLELDFTGIESNTPTTFKLYPNPVKDELFIKGMSEAVLPFEIYSTDGKKVLCGTTSGAIDVNALKKGSYQLKIKEQTIPFVKQ